MKKGISVFLCAVLLCTAAFGADISWGVGLWAGPLFDVTDNVAVYMDTGRAETAGKNLSTDVFFGFDFFFDAKYVEADIGVYFGSAISLNFGLLGKYPFTINKRFTLFPLLGAGYTLALAMADYPGFRGRGDTDFEYKDPLNPLDPEDPVPFGARHDEIWFKAGIGLDITLKDRIFLRNELLWGLRLDTPWEKDRLTYVNKNGLDATWFHHGIIYKVAVGFKLGRTR
jgi:hypothetical protein